LKDPNKIHPREITPPTVYFNRRHFIRAGVLAASAVATGVAYRKLNPVGTTTATPVQTAKIEGITTPPPVAATVASENAGFRVDEAQTSLENITHYNNFYEFSTDKEKVAVAAANFKTDGWKVSVEGQCNKPRIFDLDELLALSAPEERVYRMRCVEGWSLVVPWVGYSLSKLLNAVEPLSSARYVAFETLMDPMRMPGQRSSVLDWPYVEGLRMDESREQSQLYRPLCSRCGTLSTLARVEPAEEPNHDLRTFECPACGHSDVVKVKFR